MSVTETEGPTEDTAVKPGGVITISSDTDEGIGCILSAGAFAIVLWALYTYGIPLVKFIFGG